MDAVIADDHAHNATAVGEGASFHLHDFALYGLRYVRGEGRDGTQIGQILIGAREVEEQIADGAQAEASEKFPTRRRRAGQRTQVRGKRVIG